MSSRAAPARGGDGVVAAAAAGPGASGRQALFARLKERKQLRLGTEERIERRGAVTAEVSCGQRRLWFLEQFEPGNPRFNMVTALRLRGHLSPAALAASLATLAARHEVLRTRFVAVDGRPLQVVTPPAPVPLPVTDLASLPAAHRDAELDRLYRGAAHRPFDLERGPLLRAGLLRLAAAEHVLLLAMHQITVDRWSRGLSVAELTELYVALIDGRRPELPELSIQYADFAHWQRERLQGRATADLVAHWRQRLERDGRVPVLDLPGDRPRPPVQTFRGGNLYSALPPAVQRRCEECARQHHATLFMVLVAGLAAVLARHTGSDDIVVGSPVANRQHGQLAPLIGFFLNLVVLRVNLGGNPTFAEIVGRVREVALDAFAHQDLPFEQLVEHLTPERDLSRHPLFQTAIVLQNSPMPPLVLPGLTASLIEVDWGTATYDLSLFFWETALWERLPAGLSLIANFNADLFDATTVQRLVRHLTLLLDGGAAQPASRLVDLPLLDAGERHQVQIEWSAAAAAAREAGGAAATLDGRLRAAAAAHPHRVAAQQDSEHLSYGELVHQAGRLAHRLPLPAAGATVALALAPSLHLVVAAAAVVTAGGAYLALDPQAPPARQAAVLHAAAPAALLTSAARLSRLPAPHPPALCVDDLPPADTAGDGAAPTARRAPLPQSQPQGLAYVVHTSGSTGAPRLVGVPHDAVLARLAGGGFVELGAGDCVAQLANPAFDAFAFELWAPLLHGARLLVVDRDTALSAERFQAAIARHQIGSVFLTTAHLVRLAAAAPHCFAGLRHVLFGGEAAPAAPLATILAAGPPAHLLHLYGPTEAAVFATCHKVRAVAPDALSVPVGRPLRGGRVAVLDALGAATAAGVEGDLYLAGAGLARGYLDDAAATAAAFLPDPSGDAGARRYCTGDRARWRGDGALELRGRRDRQVKIRGHRVEPAEIEAALLRHPALAAAAVVVYRRAGEPALAACVVAHPGTAPPTAEELTAALRAQLPAYMLPAPILELPALPCTANGKLDRAALGERVAAAAAPGDAAAAAFAAPATAGERRLAEIWGAVLGRAAAVGRHDDFFALGGHSLHVVEVLTHVQRACGVRLRVRQLYESPTPAALALAVAAATRTAAAEPAVQKETVP